MWGAALAMGLLGGCSPDEGSPPNLALVLVDTLRADHTSLYGYERPTTPELERIASEGVVFERHLANAPWTKPSVASLLTGLHPTAHGSRLGQFATGQANQGPWIEVLSDRHRTFVEHLQEAGFRTGAFVSNQNLNEAWGYAQGYDEYRFLWPEEGAGFVGIDLEATERAIGFLESEPRPAFAWLHLMAVHQYQAPPAHRLFRPESWTPVPEKGRSVGRLANWRSIEGAVAMYDAAVHYDDELVGRLYDRARALPGDTCVLVTSDHGEEFGEHAGFGHASTLYNEQLEVPLVIAGPGIPSGQRATGLTDSLDLFPTILELARLDPADRVGPGQSLLPGGHPTDGKAASFAEQHYRGDAVRFSLRQAETKWIESFSKRAGRGGLSHVGDPAGFEAFRNRTGPETADERFEPSEARSKEALDRLAELRERALTSHAALVGQHAVANVEGPDLERLRALGYLDEEE